MLRQASRSSSPADVARVAAEVARRAVSLDLRLWAQRALALYVPRSSFELDAQGRWYQRALGQWAQTVAVMREPAAVGELVQAPWRTIAYRMGDCDDLAAAVAALAAVAGLPAAVATYDVKPGFAHAVALVGDDWTPGATDQGFVAIDSSGAHPFAPPTIPNIYTVHPP